MPTAASPGAGGAASRRSIQSLFADAMRWAYSKKPGMPMMKPRASARRPAANAV
jgi:hypothetical protein